MNSSVSMFGELSSGYEQYPEDGSSDILKSLYKRCKASTQIVVHRNDYMMYYIYLRKFNKNRYIGFCIANNGYYTDDIEKLFGLFEDAIDRIAFQGIFLRYTGDGDIVLNNVKLQDYEEEIDFIIKSLKRSFDETLSSFDLPHVDYSVSKDSQKEFSIADNMQDIVLASYTYGFTFIHKDKGYDTISMNDYQSVLRNLKIENETLKKENERILKKKKQSGKVVLLLLIVVACVVGLFCQSMIIESIKSDLRYNRDKVSELEKSEEENIYYISKIEDSLKVSQKEYQKEVIKRKAVELNLKSLFNHRPFFVTSCSVSADEFSFDYYAPKERKVIVTLKAIERKSGEIIYNNHTITVCAGRGSLKLPFGHRLNTGLIFHVILQYDGNIIAGKYW